MQLLSQKYPRSSAQLLRGNCNNRRMIAIVTYPATHREVRLLLGFGEKAAMTIIIVDIHPSGPNDPNGLNDPNDVNDLSGLNDLNGPSDPGHG